MLVACFTGCEYEIKDERAATLSAVCGCIHSHSGDLGSILMSACYIFKIANADFSQVLFVYHTHLECGKQVDRSPACNVGTMNVCSTFHGNSSSSCGEISVWTSVPAFLKITLFTLCIRV